MIVDELVFMLDFKGGKKAAESIKSVETELDKAEKQYKELEAQAKKTGGALDKAAAESQRKVVASLRAQRDEINKNIARQKAMREGFKALGSSITSVSAGISRAADTGLKFAFAGAALGAGAAAASVNALADQADRVKNVSAALGLTTDRFQELEFAAEKSRLTSEQFQNGMRQMAANLRLVATSAGKGEAAGAIKQLGLDWEQLLALSPDEQLLKIADAAQKYGNSAQRNAALARIFGEESGAKFAELLNGGSAAIEDLSGKAREYGRVLSTGVLNAADDVAEATVDMKAALTGVTFTIAQELLPFAKEITETIRDWAVQNRGLIRERVREWIEKVKQAITALRPTAEAFARTVGQLVTWFSKLNPETVKFVAKLALITAGVAKMVPLINGAVLGFKNMQLILTGAGAASMANPILAIGAALAVALPLALQLGDALGDINKEQNTAKTRGFAQQSAKDLPEFLARQRVGPTGKIAGTAQLVDRLTELGTSDREQVGQATLRRIAIRRRRAVSRGAPESVIRNIDQLTVAVQGLIRSADEVVLTRNAREQTRRAEEERERRAEIKESQRRAAADARRLASPAGSTVSDAELSKIIAEAAKSGQNLDRALAGRRIAGNAPPTILVQVTNNTTNVGGVEISVDAPDGVSPREVAALTKQHFDSMLEDNLRRNSRSGPRAAL